MHSTGSDRGVSVAVTHILAIGVTAVLIGVLFAGMGSLVELQTDRSAESSLKTIGERLSGEISHAERLEADFVAEHPSTVSGMSYSIEMVDNSGGDQCGPLISDDVNQCLLLTASGADVQVHVPVTSEIDDGTQTRGGTLAVTWEDPTGEDGYVSIERVS